MANTIVSPRRLPFPLGTKMVFAQSIPPTDWTLDVTDNDRFLRVVSGAGGGIGGPDNLSTVSNPTLNHAHGSSHLHAIEGSTGNHNHSMSHTHSSGSTDDMSTSANETSVTYRLRDDGSGWTDRSTHHIVVTGGTNNEGQHNHNMDPTGGPNNSNTGTLGASTGSTDAGTDTVGLAHSHSVNGAFRPIYFDVIIATLTQ